LDSTWNNAVSLHQYKENVIVSTYRKGHKLIVDIDEGFSFHQPYKEFYATYLSKD
jgi:hypothetical protein